MAAVCAPRNTSLLNRSASTRSRGATASGVNGEESGAGRWCVGGNTQSANDLARRRLCGRDGRIRPQVEDRSESALLGEQERKGRKRSIARATHYAVALRRRMHRAWLPVGRAHGAVIPASGLLVVAVTLRRRRPVRGATVQRHEGSGRSRVADEPQGEPERQTPAEKRHAGVPISLAALSRQRNVHARKSGSRFQVAWQFSAHFERFPSPYPYRPIWPRKPLTRIGIRPGLPRQSGPPAARNSHSSKSCPRLPRRVR
jgi:hypothetical protein